MTSATVAGLIALGLALPAAPLLAQPRETLSIDASAPAQPFAHFWEHMFGSGRAVLSLRESYREDLRAVREATAVSYVRFHALLLMRWVSTRSIRTVRRSSTSPRSIRPTTVCSRMACGRSSS